jgi:hypothetical protein
MTNGKQKGKRGELELCTELKGLFGWDVQRSVQYNGNAGDADLIVKGLPELFIECKRVQALNIPRAMSLAVQQAGPSKTAIVCHRRNHEPWLVTCQMSDLMALWRIMSLASSATTPGQSEACSDPGTT